MSDAIDVEALLRSALVPIEPAEGLSDRLERALSELRNAAAGELAEWELGAMRDPRNWGRPVAAILVGGAAAGALVLVRARQRRKRRAVGRVSALGQGIRDVARDVRKRARR